MSRVLRRWFMGIGGIAVVACTDSNAPPSPAVELAFTMQPSNATAGVAIDPGVAVAIEDASGDLVPSATTVVTVTLGTNPGGDTLQGTASVAAVDGVAIFSNLHIDKSGAGYTLKAASGNLTGATSTPFDISAGPAAKLFFTTQPSNAMGGAAIAPPVQVVAQDSFGNRATEFADSVAVALGGNPAPGTLSGTTVVRAVSGVATFSDLSIEAMSLGYTLTASARGLTSVSSVPFAIATPTASLTITAATSGSLPDPDGYAACIDPTSDGHGGITCAYDGPLAVGVNGSGTVTVDTGAHTVQLTGVAANCAVAGDNPRAVHTARADTAAVPFAVACEAATLHLTTSTTGASLDPDGYSVCVDTDPWESGCLYDAAIGVNGGITMSVTAGTHIVQLDGVAANCTVSGDNPRTVEAGAATAVSFVVACVASGAVHVTTATTGIDVPGAYGVCFDPNPSGTRCSGGSAWVPANGTKTISDVVAGPHIVSLTVAVNCTISGSRTRAVTVPQDGTVDVAFDVGCVEAERIAFSVNGTIVVSRADVSDPHGITPGLAPAWSPNGARFAYECGQDICAINADSTGFARLTFDAAGNHHPTWAPDGSKIAFAATHAGVTDLYVMAANGSGVARLTQGVGFVGSPTWSPDGTSIVFDCQVDAGNDDLCSVHADGTGFARLTSDPARDYGAAWKPNGSTLAFATTRYGADEIVLMSSAGGSVTRIGAGLPGFAPTWSPDGSQLAFVVYEICDDWCANYDVIFVGTVDGAVVRTLGVGETPAWKPHP